MKTTPEETQTYRKVLGQIDDLKNRLQKEKLVRKWLEIESKVQRKLIGQLKNLYPIPHLAYPKCILGHRQCPINHMKYNYVKPLTQSCKIPSPIKKKEQCNYSAKPCIGNVSYAKMCRTIDQLQSTYGLPPPSRFNF